MDYPTDLGETIELLNNEKTNIPDLFCKFVSVVKTFQEETLPDVEDYFTDMNVRIEEYKEQYQILLHELGVLCSEQQTKAEISIVFFQKLVDFFRLAYSVYKDQPEKLQQFHQLLQRLRDFVKTGELSVQGGVQGEPLQKALLLQLTNLAWALTSSNKSMESVARQVGGSLKKQSKHKTRKQKRKQTKH